MEPELRRLSVPGFVGIVVVYLAVIQVAGRLATAGLDEAEYGEYTTTEEALVGLLLPVGLSLLFVYGVVAALGWWRPVFVEGKPVRRWVWIVPATLVASVLLGLNYSDLFDKDVGFVLVLLLATQCVGFAEEGLFRGVGVTTFRVNGFAEGRVALWSSVVFGLVHLTNFFGGEGVGAVAQAFVVMLAGYFFYLVRRVSRGNVLNSVLHGLFDFTLLSSFIAAGEDPYPGAFAPAAVYVVLGVVLLVRRHRIEPAPTRARGMI